MEIAGKLKISVLGLGFVGLTTALSFADKGFCVHGYDIDADRGEKIANGEAPFLEPGLGDALKRTLGKSFFIESTAARAASDSQLVFFCVGTPGLFDGTVDLSQLYSAIDSVINAVTSRCVLVVKSTVPPGTLAGRITPYLREKGIVNSLAGNPEFLREGKCWEDFTHPDRIICGVTDDASQRALAGVYAPYDAPVRFVSPTTAEYIKYLSNTMLAALVSYTNEMALLAETIGDIDVGSAFSILREDKRFAGLGTNGYIYPGCGYGGYCLPKDAGALLVLAASHGVEMRILSEVIALNENMAVFAARKIEEKATRCSDKIGILGLSFKPGSDDVRNSPSAKIIAALIASGYSNIYAYDPVASKPFRDMYGFDITHCESKEAVCGICDIIAVVTAWDEFRGIHRIYPRKKWCDCQYFLEG